MFIMRTLSWSLAVDAGCVLLIRTDISRTIRLSVLTRSGDFHGRRTQASANGIQDDRRDQGPAVRGRPGLGCGSDGVCDQRCRRSGAFGARGDVRVETQCRGACEIRAATVESAPTNAGTEAIDGIARAADALM